MRFHLLTGVAAVALATISVNPAWAGSDEVAGTEAKPGSSVDRPAAEGGVVPEGGDTESMVPAAVQTESNADTDIGESGTHVRADSIEPEDLGDSSAEPEEDPAPQGYTTNVPPENIEDGVDLGQGTPDESTAPTEERLASETPNSAEDIQEMQTAVENGEYVEESAEHEQASMAETDENTDAVEAAVAEGDIPTEAKPQENWFGCSDEDGSEGGTCEDTGNAAEAPEGDVN